MKLSFVIMLCIMSCELIGDSILHKFIKFNEGLRTESYNCIAGVKTIGYGLTDKDIVAKGSISKSEAERLLDIKLKEVSKQVDKICRDKIFVDLDYLQKVVLIDMVFQYGYYAIYTASDLHAAINSGKEELIYEQLLRWTKIRVNGKLVHNKNLIMRCKRRIVLWNYHNQENTEENYVYK